MEAGILQFAEEVYGCRACSGLGFESPNPDGPYFKFPPTIGALGEAPLLFVGINPRISKSNRPLHGNLMQDLDAFKSLAGNRVGRRRYIAVDGLERHYLPHVDIAAGIFPGKTFEEVAAVTELFLCAKENSRGLPIPESPCAERFLERTISLIKPRIVFPVGRMVLGYFQQRSRSQEDVFSFDFMGNASWVVPMSHPGAYSKNQDWPIGWTIEKAREVLRDA